MVSRGSEYPGGRGKNALNFSLLSTTCRSWTKSPAQQAGGRVSVVRRSYCAHGGGTSTTRAHERRVECLARTSTEHVVHVPRQRGVAVLRSEEWKGSQQLTRPNQRKLDAPGGSPPRTARRGRMPPPPWLRKLARSGEGPTLCTVRHVGGVISGSRRGTRRCARRLSRVSAPRSS